MGDDRQQRPDQNFCYQLVIEHCRPKWWQDAYRSLSSSSRLAVATFGRIEHPFFFFFSWSDLIAKLDHPLKSFNIEFVFCLRK